MDIYFDLKKVDVGNVYRACGSYNKAFFYFIEDNFPVIFLETDLLYVRL